ncbi:ubiquitin-related modifier 1 [Baffinella frigidus]|nr:ubiquitin-related modifier 1 [Cryptophyta sp. CCMP2293]
MQVKVQFSGGLELLFGGQKEILASVPTPAGSAELTVRDVIAHIKDQHVNERPEMFLQGETVRPGILVLVNDADWELCGGLDYCVEPNDCLTFISTLHGG